MKWYELRRWYRCSTGSGNADIGWSNSVDYLKERADKRESYNFIWEWKDDLKRFQSGPKVLDNYGSEFCFYSIRELDEDQIVYIPEKPEIIHKDITAPRRGLMDILFG